MSDDILEILRRGAGPSDIDRAADEIARRAERGKSGIFFAKILDGFGVRFF